MADVNDPQRYTEKFENQLAKLRAADIEDRDRERILAYVRHLDASGDVNTGTIVSRINRLRLSAERADTALVDMDDTAVESFVFDLKHERDLADGTLRNYRKALRRFFDWLDRDWAEDIHVGGSPKRTVDPNKLLSMDEIETLLDVATSPRDQALIGIAADSGLRIGAIASLRIRHVDFSGPTASVTINEEANVKDASGTTPLTWSEGYVASWLDVHPRRDNPDAPLIHVTDAYWDPESEGDGSLDYQYLARRIKAIADDADIARDRVKTHNFRKSAISRWIREGMSEQAIKHRAHWDVDTEQFSVYSGVRDEELNDQIREHYGLEAAEDPPSRPNLPACPRCGTALSGSERFCPSCAAALDDRAAAKVEDVEDALFDSAAGADMTNAELLNALRTRYRSDPEMRQLLDHAEDSSS